ncbi:hypothetical protein ACH3XW_13570 [Acanthocheilonema viteae]
MFGDLKCIVKDVYISNFISKRSDVFENEIKELKIGQRKRYALLLRIVVERKSVIFPALTAISLRNFIF